MCSSGATCLCWRSVLLLEEIGELAENHRPVASSFKSIYHTMETTACPRNRLSLFMYHIIFKTVTVRVYVIIHFCDSMWSLWVEANLVVYIYFAFGDPIIKKEWILVFNALSAIFQLYHCDQFYWWRMPEYPERTIDPGQATGKLYHLRLRAVGTLFVIYKGGREPTLYWW